MTARPMPEWCADCGEIARLLRWLQGGDGLDVRDAIAIVEKPWNWDREYQEMCAEQRPKSAAEKARGE